MMTSTDLVVAALGGLLGTGLMVVAGVKSVRSQGLFPRRWAPGSLPWFLSGVGVIVLTAGFATFTIID